MKLKHNGSNSHVAHTHEEECTVLEFSLGSRTMSAGGGVPLSWPDSWGPVMVEEGASSNNFEKILSMVVSFYRPQNRS